jgi:uncharacterized membrane protein
MRKDRLLAFSDGVFAIIITIMVLELKVPTDPTFSALLALAPKLASYLLSFIYVAIYWNNHHHMLETVRRVNGPTLWANMALLFCLSLVPFTTAWMGESRFAPVPTVVYGVFLLLSAACYTILRRTLIAAHPDNILLKQATGDDLKGKISLVLYVTGTAMALIQPLASLAFFVAVAMIWLVPDRRIEAVLTAEHNRRVD